MADMSKEELQQAIAKLEPLADTLGFADKAKLVRLQNKLDGMALAEIAAKLQAMPTADADDLRSKVNAAQAASNDRQAAADAFNRVIGLAARALDIVL